MQRLKHDLQVNAAAEQASSESEDYGDGYARDLMGDEANHAKLAAMTKLDRQMESLERSDRSVEPVEKRKATVAKKQRENQREQQEAAGKVCGCWVV